MSEVPHQTENKQILKNWGFRFRMAEKEDVCSPPARAAHLQLAAEQALTGGHWTPKRCPTSEDKEAAAETEGGAQSC